MTLSDMDLFMGNNLLIGIVIIASRIDENVVKEGTGIDFGIDIDDRIILVLYLIGMGVNLPERMDDLGNQMKEKDANTKKVKQHYPKGESFCRNGNGPRD